MEASEIQDVYGKFLRGTLPHSTNSSSYYGLQGGTGRKGFINSHLGTQGDAFLRMMLIP